MNGFIVCETGEVNAILFDKNLPPHQKRIVFALMPVGFVHSQSLCSKWGVCVWAQPDWIGTHLALLEAAQGQPVIPTGTRIEFTQ